MILGSYSKNEKYLLTAIIFVVVCIIVVLIFGISSINSNMPRTRVPNIPEVAPPLPPTEAELHMQAVERAEQMHQQGDAKPTIEQLDRMKTMNASTETLTDQERRVLLESMQ